MRFVKCDAFGQVYEYVKVNASLDGFRSKDAAVRCVVGALVRFCPFVDSDGFLHVSGRLAAPPVRRCEAPAYTSEAARGLASYRHRCT